MTRCAWEGLPRRRGSKIEVYPHRFPEAAVTRRDMLAGTSSALAWMSLAGTPAAQTPPLLRNMGAEPPGFGHRNRAGGFDILEHGRSLGLGAVRLALRSPDLEAARDPPDTSRELRHAPHRQRAAPQGGRRRRRL
jgi:hypothetical protein